MSERPSVTVICLRMGCEQCEEVVDSCRRGAYTTFESKHEKKELREVLVHNMRHKGVCGPAMQCLGHEGDPSFQDIGVPLVPKEDGEYSDDSELQQLSPLRQEQCNDTLKDFALDHRLCLHWWFTNTEGRALTPADEDIKGKCYWSDDVSEIRDGRESDLKVVADIAGGVGQHLEEAFEEYMNDYLRYNMPTGTRRALSDLHYFNALARSAGLDLDGKPHRRFQPVPRRVKGPIGPPRAARSRSRSPARDRP